MCAGPRRPSSWHGRETWFRTHHSCFLCVRDEGVGSFGLEASDIPCLGFSGGTCNSTCETVWDGAGLSMWASILLFPCGLIALARPWSWFRSGQDIHDPVVKVRVGIVAGIALIAVISFGWPALLVVGIALIIYAATGWANE